MYLSVKGVGQVTAADIQADSEVEILNPSLHLATLTERDTEFNMEIGVTSGTRYVSGDKHIDLEGQLNVIPIDSYFSPVEKVCYDIEPEDDERLGKEKLALQVWTDGSIMPNESLSRAAKILNDYLNHFMGLKAGLKKTQKDEPLEGVSF